MELKDLQAKADTKLAEFWTALAVRQEAYRLKRGSYFQLVATDPVVDGKDTTFVVKHPSDAVYRTDVKFAFNSPIPFQIMVDTWGNDKAIGYSMTAIVELPDKRRFKRSRTLTDTRVRKKEIIGGPKPEDIRYGDWVLEGSDPVIQTAKWERVEKHV